MSDNDSETQLAVMTEPKFGMRDMSRPAFWFSVSFGDSMQFSSLIVLSVESMVKVVTDANIGELKDLKNRPCQIKIDYDNTVDFVKVLNV